MLIYYVLLLTAVFRGMVLWSTSTLWKTAPKGPDPLKGLCPSCKLNT